MKARSFAHAAVFVAAYMVLGMVSGCSRQPPPEPSSAPVAVARESGLQEPPSMTAPSREPSAAVPRMSGLHSDIAESPEVDEVTILSPGDGFLWVPAWKKTGRLAVLLPPTLQGHALSCSVEVPDGEDWRELIVGWQEDTTTSSETARPRFSFPTSGEGFPSPCYVVVERDDGDTLAWRIDRPAEILGDLSDIVAARSGFMPDGSADDPGEAEWEIDASALDIREPGDGFEWVPGAVETDHLTVYLPRELEGPVLEASVAILGPQGWMPIETGIADNTADDRPCYRFSRPGAWYPDHCHLVVRLRDGSEVAWAVRGTSRSHR